MNSWTLRPVMANRMAHTSPSHSTSSKESPGVSKALKSSS